MIKKLFSCFLKGVAVLCMAIFLFPTQVFADEKIDLYGRLDQDIKKINELTDHSNSTNDDTNALISKLNSYQVYFLESSKYYENLIKSTDTKISAISSRSKDNANLLSTNLNQMVEALKNQDQGKYDTSLSQFNGGINKYNQTIDELNEGATDWGPIYIYSSIIFGFISLLLLIKSRTKPQLASEKTKKQCEWELFKSSLWPTLGSIITLVWYYSTPPGGSYYILWGPMLIGFFYFLKQSWVYFNEVRPGLRSLIKEERAVFVEAMQIKEKTNYCTHCGEHIEGQSNFCTHCGENLKEV